MTPSSTGADHESIEPAPSLPDAATREEPVDADLDEQSPDADLDEESADAAGVEPAGEEAAAPSALPRRRRRVLSAVTGTVAFEVLYLLAITVIALATAGTEAVGPTLQSVVTGPFVWVPATVFLLCALVVGLPLQGARRAPVLTGLVVGVVVYAASTLVVLLVAAGPSALGVYVPELSVYPFFLTAIIAREVMAWTRWGRPRLRRAA